MCPAKKKQGVWGIWPQICALAAWGAFGEVSSTGQGTPRAGKMSKEEGSCKGQGILFKGNMKIFFTTHCRTGAADKTCQFVGHCELSRTQEGTIGSALDKCWGLD